jgi:filamentous hemagglutinin
VAEGFQAYSLPVDPTTNTATININDITGWQTATEKFIGDYGLAIRSRLLKNLALDTSEFAGFSFVPGLEIDSTGNLTLNTPWDFASWRSGGIPFGMLTLRAAGNLLISQNLVDHPTTMTSLLSTTAQPSWGMTLVAGADLSSSNPTAIVKQTGAFKSGTDDLTIANNTVVYTESAPLRLAAGGDLIIGSGTAPRFMINATISYSAATYSGAIDATAGYNVSINGGAIESATGNIAVNAGNDLKLDLVNSYLGSIRTTGELTGSDQTNLFKNISNYWHYGNGGSIEIDVKGNVNGADLLYLSNIGYEGWDSYNITTGTLALGWSASYVNVNNSSRVTEGLATMAGGNLTVYAGGDFTCQTGTFSPYAYTNSSNGTLLTSTAKNDSGDLTIFSGGDMQGRFLIADGIGELRSMGNFGVSSADANHTPIELFNATLNVTAQGDVNIGAVVNPTIARPGSNSWDLEYSPNTSISFTSVNGNASLYGDDVYYGASLNGNFDLLILPPTVAVIAAGNIDILSDFALAPYKYGEIKLEAGKNIDGLKADGNRAAIHMSEESDGPPGSPYKQIYGPQGQRYGNGGDAITAQEGFFYYTGNEDPYGILHADDKVPIVISSGGDIGNLMLFLPKAAQITAGGNIRDIYYFGHNDTSTDVTIIKAGGNILFSSLPNYDVTGGLLDTGIQLGGPGTLIVEAGGSMDLGTTAGIQVVGNIYDPSQLPGTGATLIVASGYTKDFADVAADAAFFATLRKDGAEYSKDMAAGDTAEANQVIAGARADVIAPFFAGSAAKGSGDIDMTLSQISTLTGAAPIFIFARGSLNVGRSTFITAAQVQSTGVFTAEGGAINIYANGDVNVNESRVMTFMGGDITVWSDDGSINAGIGSKTEVDATPPELTQVNGVTVVAFSPPSVGSGIRAVTYNPDPEADAQAPLAGNIYLFAPTGVINAGQAGIAGRNVILGAVQVLNAQNISFTQGSVGIPLSNSLAGLTALTGTGSISQAMQDQQAAMMSATAGRLAPGNSISDALSTAWLEVRVLSFFDVDQDDSTWEKADN